MAVARITHNRLLDSIRQLKFDFTAVAQSALYTQLQQATKIEFPKAANWKRYYHELLFLLAYPGSSEIYTIAKKEMARISQYLHTNRHLANALVHSGLPGTWITGCFSQHLNKDLFKENPAGIKLHSLAGNKELAMQWLSNSLTGIEKEMLSEETFSWKDWLKKFAGKSTAEQLFFLLQQTDAAVTGIAAREACFATFGCFTSIRLPDAFSRFAGSTGNITAPYFHKEGLQKKGYPATFPAKNNPPKELKITRAQQQCLVQYARHAIISFFKETDPFTYAQVKETAFYDCGRGISVAVFYMLPEKKLMLETYAGYLLLKNNIPVAYGGGWLLGKQCRFGLNILPWFRGGESLLICQTLLQLYQQVFRAANFIIEPFQIGKNNAEGITSGAFWFYYKMGFRPLQPALAVLAEKEYSKMLRTKKYRSTVTTLKQLSESYLLWQTDTAAPAVYYDIIRLSNQVTSYIKKEFGNSRPLAEKHCRKTYGRFAKKIPSSLLLMDVMAPAGKKLSEKTLLSLSRLFTLKAGHEKEFTLQLQQETAFFQLLETCMEIK